MPQPDFSVKPTDYRMGEPTPNDHERQNALAWFASIVKMVDIWRAADQFETDGQPPDYSGPSADDARQTIEESVLSVEVRSDWYAPGAAGPAPPAEFAILLSTGGPACRLVGDLNEHGEPESAHLESQDWFKPWTAIPVDLLVASLGLMDGAIESYDKVDSYLCDFARCFYFGDGA